MAATPIQPRPTRSVVVYWLGGGTPFNCTQRPRRSVPYDDLWDEESNTWKPSPTLKAVAKHFGECGYSTEVCSEAIANSIDSHWTRKE